MLHDKTRSRVGFREIAFDQKFPAINIKAARNCEITIDCKCLASKTKIF